MAHDKEKILLAVSMYKAGKSRGEIVRELGIATDTLYRWLRKNGENPDRRMAPASDALEFKLRKFAKHIALRAVHKGVDPDAMLRELSRRVREEYAFLSAKVDMAEKTLRMTRTQPGRGDVVEQFESEKKFYPGEFPEALQVNEDFSPQIAAHEALHKRAQEAKKVVMQHFLDNPGFTGVTAPDGTPILAEEELHTPGEDPESICEKCGNLKGTEYCCEFDEVEEKIIAEHGDIG